MLDVKFYDTIDDALLKFAVVISQSKGKWVFCKHKERDTYEVLADTGKKAKIFLKPQKESYRRRPELSDLILSLCVFILLRERPE